MRSLCVGQLIICANGVKREGFSCEKEREKKNRRPQKRAREMQKYIYQTREGRTHKSEREWEHTSGQRENVTKRKRGDGKRETRTKHE